MLNRVAATGKRGRRPKQELRARHLRAAAALGNRAAFSQAFAQGWGVTEAAPETTAAAELRGLAGGRCWRLVG